MSGNEPFNADDRTERFVALLGKAQLKLQAYVVMLVPNPSDADEVLQNTNIALWRKFDEFEPGTSFLAWARAVALIEAKRFRQAAGRDRLMFNDDLMDRLAATVDRDADRLAAERDALADCLGKLPEPDRQLVQRCYQGEESIAAISGELGLQTGTLYVKLHRLRRLLFDCITGRLGREGRR